MRSSNGRPRLFRCIRKWNVLNTLTWSSESEFGGARHRLGVHSLVVAGSRVGGGTRGACGDSSRATEDCRRLSLEKNTASSIFRVTSPPQFLRAKNYSHCHTSRRAPDGVLLQQITVHEVVIVLTAP